MSVAMQDSPDRRYHRRWIINESIDLTVGENVHGFKITDISAGGAQVLSDRELKVGAPVRLQIPGGLVIAAKVVHVMDGGAGIKFEIGATEQNQLFEWIANMNEKR